MGIGGWKSIRGALKDNLVARSCNATKGAVSIDRSPTTRVVASLACVLDLSLGTRKAR